MLLQRTYVKQCREMRKANKTSSFTVDRHIYNHRQRIHLMHLMSNMHFRRRLIYGNETWPITAQQDVKLNKIETKSSATAQGPRDQLC